MYQKVVYGDAYFHLEARKMIFVDARGGKNKTFSINLLRVNVRVYGKIALAMASLGIAAVLKPGGNSTRSCFNTAPLIRLTENTPCNSNEDIKTNYLLSLTALLVWGERPLIKSKAFESVD